MSDKVLFCTSHSVGTKHEELAAITVPVMKAYCERHGYGLAVAKCDYTPESHVAGLKFILDQFADHQIIVSLGADVLIMNHSLPVEKIAPTHHPLTLANEQLNLWPINNDVCIWRQGVGADLLLQRLIDDAPIWLKYPWLWQNHLWNLMRTQPHISRSVKIVPSRVMNATHQPGFSRWQLGDWVIHFLDMKNEDKIALARAYLPLIGNGDATFYPV